MNKIIICLILFACTSTIYAQSKLNIGDNIPEIQLTNLLNSTTPETSLSNLKGKVIILDFWATWCGPCIPAMKNLIQLQDEFSTDLQVIGIAEDKPERLQRFINNLPSKVWFGLQTKELQALFPYRILSHAIIINPKGKVVAITSTDNITKEIIKKVKEGKSISLPFKQENIEFDYQADPFPPENNQNERVLLKGRIAGVSSFSKGYLNDEMYNGKRLTLINQTIPSMYRYLYKKSYHRTIFEIDEEKYSYKDPKNKYCLDVIVKTSGDEMYARGIQKLKETFEVKAKLEKRTIPVYILTVTDEWKLKTLQAKSEKRELMFQGYEFHGKKIRIHDFANYIENECPVPVVDETNYLEFIDIDFVYDPQKKDSFKEELAKLGLKLSKADRVMEMLVIYE